MVAHVSNEHDDDVTPIERPVRLDRTTVREHDIRLRVVERRLKTWQALACAALAAAAGALGAVAKGLYARGERDGADAVRLDRVERSVEQLQHELLTSRRKD